MLFFCKKEIEKQFLNIHFMPRIFNLVSNNVWYLSFISCDKKLSLINSFHLGTDNEIVFITLSIIFSDLISNQTLFTATWVNNNNNNYNFLAIQTIIDILLL